MASLTYWSDRKLEKWLFSVIPPTTSGLALLVGGKTRTVGNGPLSDCHKRVRDVHQGNRETTTSA
jgi:hypothetical protein